MGNPYLITAYVFTAVLFGWYGWSIASRKGRTRRELEELRRQKPGG